jgi:hypothetical protein
MIFIRIRQEPGLRMEGRVKKMIRSFLESILPKANPDFEDRIPQVAFWLIEFPDEDSEPSREIGLDDNGQVILKTPDERNFGYWVDNDLTLNDFKRLFIALYEKWFENFMRR